MTGNDQAELRDCQDTSTIRVKLVQVGGQWIFFWSLSRPPQMRERHDAIFCADQRGDILWSMAWRFDQANRR